MPTTQLQLRRGNTAQTAIFTGAVGEVTVDIDKDTLIVHDGVTQGGFELARQNYANAAFHQANNASSTASDAYQHAGSASSYANSAYAQANTAVYASSYANSAFIKANSAFAHSNLTYDHAVSAFATANNAGSTASDAYQHAGSASSYANGAFASANTVASNLSSANTWLQTYVSTQISNLVDSAPTTLDTLNELAAALGDDANFSTSIATMVGTAGGYANSAYAAANSKLSSSGGTISGDLTISSGHYIYADYIHAYHTLSIANNALISTGPQPTLSIDGDSGSYGDILTVGSSGFFEWMSPSAGVYANSAYIHANAAFNAANTAGGDDTWARNTANAAYLQANNAAASACTATLDVITTGNYANAAFNKANTVVVGDETLSTNTANQVIDSYSTTEYRTAKYILQAISGADVHSEELLVTHNDTDVFFTEYAIVTTANSLFNVYATIQSANVTVNVSPVSADTQVDFSRISIIARTLASLEGDFMSLSGTEDLETGSGTVDLMA